MTKVVNDTKPLSFFANSKGIKSQLAKKEKEIKTKTVQKGTESLYYAQGWTALKTFSRKVKLQIPKTTYESFKDWIWVIFAKSSFCYIGDNDTFYSLGEPDLGDFVDVLAIDDEAVVAVHCMSTESLKKIDLTGFLAQYKEKQNRLICLLHKILPEYRYTFKFVLATKNYILSDTDRNNLTDSGVTHFDADSVKYYLELAKQLGPAAKYQLLGNLFEGMKVPGLDAKVPAIRGEMGGYVYYSFVIEPDKLLKIGYVLHRNKANKKLMPTYQRIIKKTRLKTVQKFVGSGGFFPNSVIVNIDTKGEPERFDFVGEKSSKVNSQLGVLHLPQKYRSVFIIDGQHRLYGYAQSPYRFSSCIPVVAFINLERYQQVKLFMQINENQKSVPKNLRNTLNSDLLWDSEDRTEQIKALKLHIALTLGEELNSPLFDRVIIGENVKTIHRCITIDTIKNGLDRGNFFSTFEKNIENKKGTFYKENNELTFNVIFPFLEKCFKHIAEALPDEWSKGDNDGYLVINANIEALLRLFSDIVDHVIKQEKKSLDQLGKDFFYNEVKKYLDAIVRYYQTLTHDQKQLIKRSYGSAGRTKVWRMLQRGLSGQLPSFSPDGLEKYWVDEDKRYNTQSFQLIQDIETFMKEDFRSKLKNYYGDNWFTCGVPKAVFDATTKLANDKTFETQGKEKFDPWDCLTLAQYRSIATYGTNWRDIFEKFYTRPGEQKGGNKDKKTEWMMKLSRIRNNTDHSYSVKKEEFEFLKSIHGWLIKP